MAKRIEIALTNSVYRRVEELAAAAEGWPICFPYDATHKKAQTMALS